MNALDSQNTKAVSPGTAQPNDLPRIVVLPPPPAPVPRESAPKTRNGKIARLPCLQRDMVNRMLRDNLPMSRIVEALRSLEVEVTERNISNWKTRGGYHEWCLAQDRALNTRLAQENLTESLRKTDATDLPEVGLQLAAATLSEFFTKPDTQKQLVADPDKFARPIAMLCRLARQLQHLQKYRDESITKVHYKLHPGRLKKEGEEEVESIRKFYSSDNPNAATPNCPGKPHRNYFPRPDAPPIIYD